MWLEAALQDIGNFTDLVSSLVFHDILQEAWQIDRQLSKLYASGKRPSSISSKTSGRSTAAGWLNFAFGRGRDLSSRQTQDVVRDLEIGQPIDSEEGSETADGVARESKGGKSCPRAGCGRSACPVR